VDLFTDEIAQKDAYLFTPRDARLPRSRDYRGDWAWETAHPAVFHYYLKNQEEGVEIQIFDEADKLVRTLQGPGKAGINTVIWDLKPDSQPSQKGVYKAAERLVKPGVYTVKIKPGSSRAELLIQGQTIKD